MHRLWRVLAVRVVLFLATAGGCFQRRRCKKPSSKQQRQIQRPAGEHCAAISSHATKCLAPKPVPTKKGDKSQRSRRATPPMYAKLPGNCRRHVYVCKQVQPINSAWQYIVSVELITLQTDIRYVMFTNNILWCCVLLDTGHKNTGLITATVFNLPRADRELVTLE